jgi:threonine synthase
MRFLSTRGAAPALSFDDVLLAGLARDGGLYVPESWPRLDAATLAGFAGRPYAEVAAAVLRPFVGRALRPAALEAICSDAYNAFGHLAVAPLRQLAPDAFLLELFHGPTLAFKDYALQLVGRLFDHVLAAKGRRATIVGATSGDTGSAAIEACRDRAALEIFILHPRGRTSDVQRRQMTTVHAANVHNVAVEGSFDDCQDIVKALFADAAFRDRHALSAVNSINFARIAAQVVYYVVAAVALGAPRRKVDFAVPSGNFGNVYAAHAARRMGLPVGRLIVGSNRNDILWRTIARGDMSIAGVEPSLSPSMDIQVASNFERLVFELEGRSGRATARAMAEFRARKRLRWSGARLARLRALFAAGRASDDETLATIARIHRETGETIDPHTAVGLKAAADVARDPRVPLVALACAHPAKFPEAIARALGAPPPTPRLIAEQARRPERFATLPAEIGAVRDFIAQRARAA